MLGHQDGILKANFNYISPHKLSLLILIRFLFPTPVRQEKDEDHQENELISRYDIVIKDEDITSIWAYDEDCKSYGFYLIYCYLLNDVFNFK